MHSAQQLQTFLHEHIPAAALLNIAVQSCDQQHVRMVAPHALNRNHKNTVFGGSMALAATLCGWSMVHLRCPQAHGNIVIQESHIRYVRPATHDLIIHTQAAAESDWQTFHTSFQQRGKGRITLTIELFSHQTLVALFEGKYVALAA